MSNKIQHFHIDQKIKSEILEKISAFKNKKILKKIIIIKNESARPNKSFIREPKWLNHPKCITLFEFII